MEEEGEVAVERAGDMDQGSLARDHRRSEPIGRLPIWPIGGGELF